MYGKIFESIYDGTLSADWKAMVVFQQFIVLANEDGVVDMTPPAIARRTGIPLDIIEHGIEKLQEPDKWSRSDLHDGRRIVLMDDHRPWGWEIVNYQRYRDMASREDKKRADRERIAAKRKKDKENQQCREVSHPVADVAHTDTDTDTDKTTTDVVVNNKNRVLGRGVKRCPKWWVLHEGNYQYASDRGFTDEQIASEEEKFRDHEFYKARKDWDACWRTWIRKSLDLRPSAKTEIPDEFREMGRFND